MTWHEGATLQERINLGHFFSINGAIKIGTQIAQGLSTLHRLNIIHRDIKPDNIHQGSDQQIRILDLGVALNSEVTLPTSMANPGTPSFMAPELFNGEQASVQSDLYALGVTLYYVLTRKYPYGEIEAFQTPNFGKIIPPTRYRPEIPEWLNNIIIKAISREKESRFETSEEMLLAFEYKDRRPVSIQKISLLDQARFEKWQLGAILSIFLNILLIYFLLIT
jgi:protein phosphatase